MSGEKLRLASLSVLGGSRHGRTREVEEVVGEVLVGSDPDCHLVVDLPSISPIHARLWTDLDQIEVNDTRAPRGVYVNTKRVEGQAVLRPGDMLWLGPPQDPGSVCVQCRFEPWVEVLPGGGEPVEPVGDAGEVPVGVADATLETGPLEPQRASVSADVAPAVTVPPAPMPALTVPLPAPLEPAAEQAEDDEAFVLDDEASEAHEGAVPEAVEAVVTEGAAVGVAEPTAASVAEPTAPSGEEADPFFVGESGPPPTTAATNAADEGVFTLDEASPFPSNEPIAAGVPPPAAPAAAETPPSAAEDEWAIAEPGPTAVESVPAPEVSDEFFVSDEPAGAAVFEPELEPPAVAKTVAPPGPAPGADEAPDPSFDFGEFEPEPHFDPSDAAGSRRVAGRTRGGVGSASCAAAVAPRARGAPGGDTRRRGPTSRATASRAGAGRVRPGRRSQGRAGRPAGSPTPGNDDPEAPDRPRARARNARRASAGGPARGPARGAAFRRGSLLAETGRDGPRRSGPRRHPGRRRVALPRGHGAGDVDRAGPCTRRAARDRERPGLRTRRREQRRHFR